MGEDRFLQGRFLASQTYSGPLPLVLPAYTKTYLIGQLLKRAVGRRGRAKRGRGQVSLICWSASDIVLICSMGDMDDMMGGMGGMPGMGGMGGMPGMGGMGGMGDMGGMDFVSFPTFSRGYNQARRTV